MAEVRTYLPNGQGTTAGFIVSEGNGYQSREVGTVKSGSGKLLGGTLMARDGAGLFVPLAAAASDGTQTFAGILYEDTDATEAAVKRTMFVRLGEVQRSALIFAGTPTDGQKNAVYATMAAANITLR